jgi:hypothetical protein
MSEDKPLRVYACPNEAKRAIAIIKPVSRSEKSTMSITLDLPQKIEALLRQRAQSTGQD